VERLSLRSTLGLTGKTGPPKRRRGLSAGESLFQSMEDKQLKKLTIAATALAVAASTIGFAPAANAAPVAASAASYGAECATVGATAAKKGADGSDLKCMKATKGTFTGKRIWSYATWPVLKDIEVAVPNSATSGFAGFGRAVADGLKKEGLIATDAKMTYTLPPYNLTLNYFNKTLAGKAGKLGVTGFAQVTGSMTSKSETMPSAGVPAARMYAEYDAIAVKANSPYDDIKELMDALEKDPKSMTIIGGAKGGVDNFTAAKIFEDQSIPVKLMSYVASSTVSASLLSDAKYAFGVSSYSDFAKYVASGDLRILGVTSEKPLPGTTIPTLKSQGVDVVVQNWRGIMLPPKTPVAAQKLVIRALDVVSKSKSYNDYLVGEKGFGPFLPGAAWGTFLKGQEVSLKRLLTNVGLL
jgi:putative tricarboxylic transport membrane protein